MNDIIDCRARGIVRLDQIFVHELIRKRRLFARVTKLEPVAGQRDSILGFQMYHVLPDTMFIGLASISAKHLYMLPVEDEDKAQTLGEYPMLRLAENENAVYSMMLVDYTVHWL
jgi:hypothetical protein